MPCRYDDYPSTIVKEVLDPKLVKKLDKLTHENDMLREALLAVPEEYVDLKMRKLIAKDQTAHRKEDLERLKKTFKERKDFTRFEKVVLADPKKPLEPQLGFDPDSF